MDDWTILLICGVSGAGKTRLAQQLAQRFSVSVLQADDVRIALQQVTTAEQFPALHYFFAHPAVWEQPPEALCAGWWGVAEVISQALEPVLSHHLSVPDAGKLIVEGDGLLPRLAAQRTLVTFGEVAPGRVCGVLLHEDDENVLLGNMLNRRRGFEQQPLSSHQRRQVQGASVFGQRLKTQAEHVGVPVVPVRPWEGLESRVLDALNLR